MLLGRHMRHEYLVAGLAAALRVGALSADAVALEARKVADQESQVVPQESGAQESPGATVTYLTARRLAALPPDTRPLPSVAVYDQLLRRRRTGTGD